MAFVLRALVWSVGLFALMRVTLVEDSLIAALVSLQGAVVQWYFASAAASVTITSSCSAADVMSLCLGVVLAYPAPWLKRLTGAALGILLIVALNIVRISTLAVLAARYPAVFGPVHVVVWPVLLSAATTAYVWQWIVRVNPRPQKAGTAVAERSSLRGRRFAWTAAGLLALHLALAPWTMTSHAMVTAGEWTAASARTAFNAVGIAAESHGIQLNTARGGFLITPECLLTPVFPLYLAAALTLISRRRRQVAALMAALPVFFVMGVLRVFVLAAPATAIASPLFLVHGFFQIVVALGLIVWICRTTAEGHESSRVDWLRVGGAIGGGVVAAAVGGPWLAAASLGGAKMLAHFAPFTLTTLSLPGDVQGVLVLTPPFQIGLLTAVWLGRRPLTALTRLLLALAGLLVSMVACLAITGAWTAYFGAMPHALLLRAWSVGVPVILAWWLFRTPSADTIAGDPEYLDFWGEVGAGFPDLGGALSTSLYRSNEQALINGAVTDLAGARILKTDLWDEARNTRIGEWMAERGARVYGIDISPATVRSARKEFGARPGYFTIADVRAVPFASGSFDAIYSMGTIEHFVETEAAVVELARLLKPGGRLILGVPNKFDPFLRPVFVGALQRVGGYGYGSEKCYSRADLRAMLEDAGLTVDTESGVLFIPGYLRMLELLFHTRMPALSWLTRPFVQFFVWIDRKTPAFRRHGYLLASVGVKPGATL